jgi:hypothetical protein
MGSTRQPKPVPAVLLDLVNASQPLWPHRSATRAEISFGEKNPDHFTYFLKIAANMYILQNSYLLNRNSK